jgi:hypothetical protein
VEDIAKLGGVVIAVVVALVAAYSYFSAEQQTVPITGREQRVSMSEDEQRQLGAQAFQQVLAEHDTQVVQSGPEASAALANASPRSRTTLVSSGSTRSSTARSSMRSACPVARSSSTAGYSRSRRTRRASQW